MTMHQSVIRIWSVFKGTIIITILIAIFVAAVDYNRFQEKCREVIAVSKSYGANVGSIGGWPFGREFRIRVHRVLNDDEVNMLARLSHKSRRIFLHVAFDCDISDRRLRNIQEKLSPNMVFPVRKENNGRNGE